MISMENEDENLTVLMKFIGHQETEQNREVERSDWEEEEGNQEWGHGRLRGDMIKV